MSACGLGDVSPSGRFLGVFKHAEPFPRKPRVSRATLMSEPGDNLRRLTGLYRTMARIRAFEETALEAHKAGEIPGPLHVSIGQEAVAAGICVNLRIDDRITSNHRGHGHAIAKGAEPKRMMAELYGRASGYCRGKGGSMHIADFSVGMLGANGVVAGGIPIAVGAAQGLKMQKSDAIVTCMFGDGAVNRGPFLEGLNWAVLYKLPVLFVCEDNGVAAFTRAESVTAGPGRDRPRQGARRRGDHDRRQQRDGGRRCRAGRGRGGAARRGAASAARAHLSHHRPHLDRCGGVAAGRGGRGGALARSDRAARRGAGRARR